MAGKIKEVSNTKPVPVSTMLIKIVLLLLVMLILEMQFHLIGKTVDNLVYDNKNHYIACKNLPKITVIEATIQAHEDVAKKIIKEVGRKYHKSEVIPQWQEGGILTDGTDIHVSFSYSLPSECEGTGRGDILITYPTHKDRVQIEQIINSDTFFGIPYRLRNN